MDWCAADLLRRAVFGVKSFAFKFRFALDRGHSRTPRAEDQVVSFVLWKILRLLPKPILYIVMFFLLGAVARA